MSFNLSAWALRNRQIVLYVMILLGIVAAVFGGVTCSRGGVGLLGARNAPTWIALIPVGTPMHWHQYQLHR